MAGTTVDVEKMASETAGVYLLYREFGLGMIEEWNFAFLGMRGELGKWIKMKYTEEEIAERLCRLGLI